MNSQRDRWAQWILTNRFGGDADLRERTMPMLYGIRDRVLAGAAIQPGDDVLDVGCGDGLLGVGALDLVDESGTVTFSDVSADLVAECRRALTDERCRFVHTGLPALDGIESASADVAMTRSVLIYVGDKEGSFKALYRVLRPGGRLSIFEPINRFGSPEPANRLWGFDATGLETIAAKVKRTVERYLPAGNPMTDFDERDLLVYAESAGFTELHLEYRVDIDRQPMEMDVDTLLRFAPNPLVPPYGELLAEALTSTEVEALVARQRELLAAGHAPQRRWAVAYLTAQKMDSRRKA
jgi:ubiquinone/menaquinone biosynthesis C-methylase UbiE